MEMKKIKKIALSEIVETLDPNILHSLESPNQNDLQSLWRPLTSTGLRPASVLFSLNIGEFVIHPTKINFNQ